MLDDFLERNDIIKVETAFVNDECYWSVILYFEELKGEKYSKRTKMAKYSAENEVLNLMKKNS
jgi:hypothetical protein